MKTPNFVIDTSDTRMFYTMRYMQNKKYKVCSIANNTETGAAHYCFSPQKRFTNDELMNIPDKSDLFCGNLNDVQKRILIAKNINYHNLITDEIFAMENSLLTAEGALMLVIRGTNVSIFNAKSQFLVMVEWVKLSALYLKVLVRTLIFSLMTTTKGHLQDCLGKKLLT